MAQLTPSLHIGKGKRGFTLPLDLVTSTQAILARKRSGKSYTASVEAEELLEHKQQVVVIDPTSAWHGLRSSADGQGAGYSIVVFGGDHADAPLDFRAGKAMAAALVEHGFSAIFDIGNLHTEEQIQFVMDLCSELLRINRTAMHLFMDEADTFAPQKPLGLLQNKCLGTVSRLVKQGGIRGIGFTMITQRPASINKDVLSQVDILTVLRMSHPLDIKAATDWIKSEVTLDFAKVVEAALPSLPVGTAFFCSASLGLGERVEVRSRRTFNSGATPKPGERKIEPKVLAKVDIEKLGQQISDSVKRAQEDSPEYLKRKIAALEADAAKGGKVDMGFIEEAQAAQKELEELRPLRDEMEALRAKRLHEMALLSDGMMSVVRDIRGLTSAVESILSSAEAMQAVITEHASELPPPSIQTHLHVLPPTSSPKVAEARFAPLSIPVSRPHVAPAEGVNEPQQRILNAMATLWAIRHANVSIEWIACTAGTTARARGFEENMRKLKHQGLVDGIRLTDAGRAIAQPVSTPATFRAALERLAVLLPSPQVDILRHLKITRAAAADLAAAMGTTERSRGFEENIRQLRKKGFIQFSGGVYALADWLQALP